MKRQGYRRGVRQAKGSSYENNGEGICPTCRKKCKGDGEADTIVLECDYYERHKDSHSR